MTNKILILSPHCDDIPLSLGATLLAQELEGEIEVCVFFTQSRYTKFEKGTADLAQTTALRRREELAAASRAGYRATFLPFPEPFARPGFKNSADIFDPARQRKTKASGMRSRRHASKS